MKTISQVLQELKQNRHSTKLVRDWKSMIPSGSRWNPGDPGKPDCKVCEGTGYIRLEGLSIGHPYFGKVIFCDCVSPFAVHNQLREAFGASEPEGFEHPDTGEWIS